TPINRMTRQVSSSYSNYNTNVQGAYPNIHDIRRWDVLSGRKLEESDEMTKRPVCVIGLTPSRELFGGIDPVGEEITVKSARFRIVGTLGFKGQANGRDSGDLIIYSFLLFSTSVV